MLHRKHYETIADCIKEATLTNATLDKAKLMGLLSVEFKKDNPLFNKDKFMDACINEEVIHCVC